MPIFQVVTRKAFNSPQAAFKWSNRYFVDATDVVSAAGFGRDSIWGAERNFHDTDAFLYEVYATDMVPNTDTYVNLPADVQFSRGLFDGGGGELMPPWNVVRVDLPTVTPGRPSRKFYRPPLYEGQTAFDQLAVGLLNAFTVGLNFLATLSQLRDVDGQPFSGYQVRGITSRRLGREAFFAVPNPPPVVP